MDDVARNRNKFIRALIYGDRVGFAEFLNKEDGRTWANERDERVPVLMRAYRMRHMDIFTDLLKAGADTNAKDEEGNTVLLLLFKDGAKNHDETQRIMELLLDHGADVNAADKNGETPLHLVTHDFGSYSKELSIDHFEMAKTLLAHKADVNAENKCGATPLHIVTLDRKTEFVQLLLDHKANVNANNIYHWANPRDRSATPLHLAVSRHPDDAIVRLLLDHQADVNATTWEGETPLGAAVRAGKTELAKLLVSLGAHDFLPNGLTFRMAIESTNEELLQFFLSKLVDSDTIADDKDNHLKFFHALVKGNRDVVSDCLRRDKSLSNAILGGVPGLMLVYNIPNEASEQIMQDLVESGANLECRNSQGSTILQVLCKNFKDGGARTERLISLILDRGANTLVEDNNGCTPLHEAARKNCLKLVRLLLRSAADANRKDSFGHSPLYEATRIQNLEMIRLLLDHQADINTQDNVGGTPLHQACSWNCLKTMQLLLDHGADVSLKNTLGDTPLHEAIKASGRRCNSDCVKVLLERGASINMCNKENVTPLDLASKRSELGVIYTMIRFSSHHRRPQLRQPSMESNDRIDLSRNIRRKLGV